MPPESFDMPFLMRMTLVCAFAPDVTQQIHSLRASGVMSFHTACAFFEARSAARKSAGSVWTEPCDTFMTLSIVPSVSRNRG